MRVFIQSDKQHLPAERSFFIAYKGFHEMGFETIFFRGNEVLNAKQDDIVVGYVDTCKNHLKRFNVAYTDIDYPDCLNTYLKRSIWKSTINEINSDPRAWPVFIKPVEDKLFTGRLVKSPKDLIGCGNESTNAEVFCSKPISFLSEYRCFVRYNKILDIRRYKGNYKHIPNYNLIEEAAKVYINAPAGYAIDFGVTKSDTLLIEVNDGFALGDYGLFHIDYAKLLSARWCQLMNLKDECNF